MTTALSHYAHITRSDFIAAEKRALEYRMRGGRYGMAPVSEHDLDADMALRLAREINKDFRVCDRAELSAWASDKGREIVAQWKGKR